MTKSQSPAESQIPLFEEVRSSETEEPKSEKPEFDFSRQAEIAFPVDKSQVVTVDGKIIGRVNPAEWKRRRLLKCLAFYMPGQSVQGVLDLCAGDTRHVVLEFVAQKIIPAHERLKEVRRPAQPLKMREEPGLAEMPGIKASPNIKPLQRLDSRPRF